MDAHLSDDLRLEDVASHVYLSPYYFSKLFKKYHGIGFNAWVNQQRMASARELLCHSDWSIASIARNLGFRKQVILQSFPSDLSGYAAGVSTASE
ncbi:hypothetical protein DMI65_18030 [Escherichia coli]|nr:hypothetical protein [Escherichia coli]